jgi:hypothetical protein
MAIIKFITISLRRYDLKLSDLCYRPIFNFNFEIQIEVYLASSTLKLKMEIDSDEFETIFQRVIK